MEENDGKSTEELFEDYDDSEFTANYLDMCVKRAASKQSESYYRTIKNLFLPGKLKGTRLLDFGCGPIVQRMAFASNQFTEIIVADYSGPSRKEVEKWLKKDPLALDWTPVLKVVADVEGYTDLMQGVEEISCRIRRSVKSVVFCDLLSRTILPDDIGMFDVVASFFCLESCCFTEESYKEGVKKLGEYVKQGGALVMEASLDCTHYVSHKKLKVLPLREPLIKEALAEAGFTIKDWFYHPNVGVNIWSDMTGTLAFSAIKN